MQEVDQDPAVSPDLRDPPEDSECFNEDYLEEIVHAVFGDSLLNWEDGHESCDDFSECFNGDYLEKMLDTDVLFGDSLLNEDELTSCRGDIPSPMELPSADSHQTDQPTGKTNTSGKRPGVPCSPWCADENTPSWPKRQSVAGTDTGSEPSPAVTAGLSTTPPRILLLHPSIQFITIPDTPGNQTPKLLRPFFGFSLPNTASPPAYILVPTISPPCKRQMPPLSPVDSAVAPVQMSSSPPGSLSDTASKAISSRSASSLYRNTEISTCKESSRCQFPTVPNMTQAVKDYVRESKTRMNQTCQDMDAGLNLTSHYVDVRVSRMEIFSCGRNRNKSLDKEPRDLFITGDTDRRKNTLDVSQIFESTNGDKPKHYMLLLGSAGMGKTTLIKKLCYDWSKDCIPQFDFVFVLDGKALTLTEPTFGLQTLLLNLSPFAPPCCDPKAVYAQIIAAPERVLIIFHGFDSLREYETLLQIQEKDLQRDSKAQTCTVRQLYSAILQRVLLPGCTLLLSSRPRGTASQLLRRTDSFLELCGFTHTDIETYLSQYFTDPALRSSALECLKKRSYLHLLCSNPGLCRLVCLVLEESKGSQVLPNTLTGLCHQVLHLKLEKNRDTAYSLAEPQTEISERQPQTQSSSRSPVKRCLKNAGTKSRARRGGGEQKEENEVDGQDVSCRVSGALEREMLSQLSYLAWQGVKANTSIIPTGRDISAKLKAFGHRTGLFCSYHLGTRKAPSSGEKRGEGREERRERGESPDPGTGEADTGDDLILLWASPFLQSYLAGVHLSLLRIVSERAFLQALAFQEGTKGRRHPQRQELELTQRFAVGILFHNRTELQRLHSYTETAFRNMVVSRQALVTKHLEDLPYADLSPSQVLQACHYIYESGPAHCDDSSKESGSAQPVAPLAKQFPEVLSFHGVQLNPSDVFAVQNVLERGAAEGRSFSLDLEDSGIQIFGLKALLGLNNINTYRACIADVIALWEQLERSGDEELCEKAVSKFTIHPLKATQARHIERLATLVNIHLHQRLSDSQSDSFLAEGVPAVKELHMLEFDLGPENGPPALPKLWELLPGLRNLQHLDLENSKMGDNGAEELAMVLVSLPLLEVLNLSQNCIGDRGVRKLAAVLKDLPKLHCLSLYSNVISDEGAESLAAVLPHMASLTELDVKYNKLTDVGAQSLGVSLRHCKKMKTLRMWNPCIPYGVFERLWLQDNRILCH